MTSHLPSKLMSLAALLSPSEKDNFKLLLGLAAGRLASESTKAPEDEDLQQAFKTVIHCASRLQPHASRVPSSGVVYHGPASFLTTRHLEDLAKEAVERRATAIPHDDHFLGCGGPLADKLAISTDLQSFVSQCAGPVAPTGIASYIYYDHPGAQIEAHVDTEVFSLNCILMLRHDFVDAPSHTVVYPADGPPVRYLLKPGELLIIFADSVIHAREPVKEREIVHILTLGYQPTVKADD